MSACLATSFYRGKNKVEKMDSSMKFYWFMYNNVSSFACFITAFYWALVYDGKPISLYKNFTNVLSHVTNSIGPLIDLMIVKHPPRIMQCIYPIMCGSFYIIFTYAYQMFGGMNEKGENFIYSALDWNKNLKKSLILSAIALLCIGIIHIILSLWQLLRIFLFKITRDENVESTHVVVV